jgi:hypothetical protein
VASKPQRIRASVDRVGNAITTPRDTDRERSSEKSKECKKVFRSSSRLYNSRQPEQEARCSCIFRSCSRGGPLGSRSLSTSSKIFSGAQSQGSYLPEPSDPSELLI